MKPKQFLAVILMAGSVYAVWAGASKAVDPAELDREISGLKEQVAALQSQTQKLEARVRELEQNRQLHIIPPLQPPPGKPQPWTAPQPGPIPNPYPEINVNGWTFQLVPLSGPEPAK